jgi:flagellar motor component MotA
MFVKLRDGAITRWINMDAVIQMRFDDDKHQTELFLVSENARLVFVDESPEEIRALMDIELERLSQLENWSIGGPMGDSNGRRR